MSVLKLAGLALFLGSNIALALPCDGFQLNLKNNLADDLLISHIKLDNAELAPRGIQVLSSKTEQAFTVNNSSAVVMAGQFSLYTASLPIHKIKIHYTLENKEFTCEYTPTSIEGDYSVASSSLPGHALFTIENR